MSIKKYNQAPLPFQGQKRRFLGQFREALQDVESDCTFVDLFGGSGLLSHTVKQLYPSANVIWNDYDNFQERLRNVAKTNSLLADLRHIVSSCPEDKSIPEAVKRQILLRISQEIGFVDYVTLSASLLFSGKYATSFEELSKHTFYNSVKKTDYVVDGYLEGVERVCCDYKELFERYKHEDAVFLIDPPYLSTDCSTYGSDNYWRLGDYLDVLTTLQGTKYFYFTSNKSQVVELCQWISNHSNFENPFENCVYATTLGTINYSASYTDIMAVKL